jgi:large subunit ribosomal protein L22
MIKGRRVEEARNTLAFTKKSRGGARGKLLQSALDNANFLSTEKGLDVDLDNLYVKSAVANDGPRMKRIRPAPMGRAYRYRAAHRAHYSDPGGAGQRTAMQVRDILEIRATAAAPKLRAKRRAPAAKAKRAKARKEESGWQEVGTATAVVPPLFVVREP